MSAPVAALLATVAGYAYLTTKRRIDKPSIPEKAAELQSSLEDPQRPPMQLYQSLDNHWDEHAVDGPRFVYRPPLAAMQAITADEWRSHDCLLYTSPSPRDS